MSATENLMQDGNDSLRAAPAIINELFFSPNITESYTNLDNDRPLKPLSSLNVFIGINNSGKSRLLRRVFSGLKDRFRPAVSVEANALIDEIPRRVNELSDDHGIPSDPAVKQSLSQLQKIELIDEGVDCLQPLRSAAQSLVQCSSVSGSPYYDREYKGLRREQAFKYYGTEVTKRLDQISARYPTTGPFIRWYVPALRSLRPPNAQGNAFRDRTKKDYFPSENHVAQARPHEQLHSQLRHEIFTGLEMYTFMQHFLLGTMEQRDLVRDYERFLSREFFDGETITIIPRIGQDQDVLHLKIGNEEEQPIPHLGDGIQQILILTLPLFLRSDSPLLLFIEEPELYLHPGLQQKLIRALLDAPGLARQTFVATHSHQFLDITLDEDRVSVFKFKKNPLPDSIRAAKPSFTTQEASNKDYPFLRELGVTNSSVMLSNCTIWVEGITDRLYWRKYLELYWSDSDEAFVEGVHYSFVEYAGACITHWSFLGSEDNPISVDRLCGELLLIADRDTGKESRHEELRKNLKERFVLLPCQEIENLLTPEVVKKVIVSYEGNGLKLLDFNQSDYRDTYLGSFIEENVLPKEHASKRLRNKTSNGNKGAYAIKSGTLKDKLEFSTRAISFMRTKADMSSDSLALCETISQFIGKHNSHPG